MASLSVSAPLTGTTDFIQRKLCPDLTHLQISGVVWMGAADGSNHNFLQYQGTRCKPCLEWLIPPKQEVFGSCIQKKKKNLRVKYSTWQWVLAGNPCHPSRGAGGLSCSSSFPWWAHQCITTWLVQWWSPQKASYGFILLNAVNKILNCPDRQYEPFSSSWPKALILAAYQTQAWHFVRAWTFCPDDSAGRWEADWDIEGGKMCPAGVIKQFLVQMNSSQQSLAQKTEMEISQTSHLVPEIWALPEPGMKVAWA